MKTESKLLKLSALGGLFFALIGIGWGLFIDSEMIRFDGIYSLISLFLSMMSIYICGFMEKKDKINFPFGKETLGPIVVAFKSIALIVMCLISLSNSFQTILVGGNPVDTGFAIVYTVISIIGCTGVYLYMKKTGKKLNSDILKAESSQWLMDTLISVGVFIGFIIVLAIENTSISYLSKYVDPVMVIITSLIFLKVPITTLIKSFKEIILVKANDEINDDINKIVKSIEREYNFEDSITRVSKTGTSLRIEIDFVFNDKTKMEDLKEMDAVREKIDKRTKHIEYDKWLNVSFTGNRKWVV
ncbi:MAG: cation diffusion facilitator family transporter [Clostridium sp.]|uniref:cation diffusion facilitator family transporter n=1 Tax=Clostridium sp. TaxID=1506 RepID=UPI00306309D1